MLTCRSQAGQIGRAQTQHPNRGRRQTEFTPILPTTTPLFRSVDTRGFHVLCCLFPSACCHASRKAKCHDMPCHMLHMR